MNPETTSLVDACISCISIAPVNFKQEQLQKTCADILDQIAGWEMILDENPDRFPEMEL